jgi:hypothetical protein
MSIQSVASPAITLTPPNRNSLAHIPGDEGWPVIGRTLAILADPKGEVERMAAKHGLIYRSRVLGETSITVLGPEANETRAVRPGQAVLVDLWLGDDPRPLVSARPDAA